MPNSISIKWIQGKDVLGTLQLESLGIMTITLFPRFFPESTLSEAFYKSVVLCFHLSKKGAKGPEPSPQPTSVKQEEP